MNKIYLTATQARTGNAKPTIRCEQCGYHNKIKPVRSQGHHRRSFLRMIYRDRNRHPGIADSKDGRTFLMILRSLGLPLEDVNNLASWITFRELGEIDKVAKRFDPTPENIGKEIRFTDAERKWYGEKYNQYSIWSSETDWNVENEKRAKINNRKRNENRKEKRQKERDAMIAACRDPNERAVIETMMRISRQPGCWHDWSVSNIIANIKSENFPAETDARRSAVRHALDRLARRRVVELEVRSRVRFATLIPQNAANLGRPTFQAKVLADQGVKPDRSVAQAEVGACATTSSGDWSTTEGLANEEVGAATSPGQPALRPVEAKVFHWRMGMPVGTVPIGTAYYDEDHPSRVDNVVQLRPHRRDADQGDRPQRAIAFTITEMERLTEVRP